MEVVIFQLKGKLAHYRKFYTNSSSLTYGIPPRTALAGCIAGMLGYEKDTYYELFAPEQAYIAIKKIQPTKKLVQSVNYIKVTSPQHLNGSKGPTQIPIELLCNWDENVIFQIYFYHKDYSLQKDLVRRLQEKWFVYPPYLGSAPFLAAAELIGVYEADEIYTVKEIPISTAIPLDCVQERGIRVTDIDGNLLSLHKENMLQYFSAERTLGEVRSYLFEENGNSINVTLKTSYYCLSKTGENIIFM